MSLWQRLTENPGLYLLEEGTLGITLGAGLYVSLDQQRPELVLMILVKVAGSIPNFLPNNKVSLRASIVVPSNMLLQTFAVAPAPATPQCTMFLPMVDKIGSAIFNTCDSPPTMKVKLAFSAPDMPPDTGASKELPCLDLTKLCQFLEVVGSTVELSIHNLSFNKCLISSDMLLT
eukprot:NODE_321_length_11054_cov_0.461524.p7 type:complete len:175 gc:universal NODE_321_length_11054_cov_0.461524:4037-4561(+)